TARKVDISLYHDPTLLRLNVSCNAWARGPPPRMSATNTSASTSSSSLRFTSTCPARSRSSIRLILTRGPAPPPDAPMPPDDGADDLPPTLPDAPPCSPLVPRDDTLAACASPVAAISPT